MIDSSFLILVWSLHRCDLGRDVVGAKRAERAGGCLHGLPAHADGDGDAGGDLHFFDGRAGGAVDGVFDGVETLIDGGAADGLAIVAGDTFQIAALTLSLD